jgi:hypothetical protein
MMTKNTPKRLLILGEFSKKNKKLLHFCIFLRKKNSFQIRKKKNSFLKSFRNDFFSFEFENDFFSKRCKYEENFSTFFADFEHQIRNKNSTVDENQVFFATFISTKKLKNFSLFVILIQNVFLYKCI